jgi:23S rRNA pseudouridine1911/1915/1917 synthase
MVVHPAPGHTSGTLVNALLYHCEGKLSGINGAIRPGIVHRIDKDTSGSIIACKNDKAHMAIAAQLKEHSLNRTYRAVAFGRIDLLNEKHNAMKSGIASYDGDELIINAPIGRHPTDRKRMCVNAPNSKEAVTGISVIKPLDKLDMTYIECRLRTGRTHQIRVHTEAIGFPLLGDPVYNRGARAIPSVIKNIDTEGQALHAYKLGFIHPTKNEYIETVAPIPSYMEKITEIC